MGLNIVDAAWLLMESDDTPMHMGVLAIFQKPKNADSGFVASLAEQLRRADDVVAPWNCRLSGLSSITADLIADKTIDLDYHFRRTALPEPGGEKDLGRVISRLHSNALDLKKPLWELHIIEGLANDRFAFYLKVHHVLVADVSAVPLLLSSLSESSRKKNMQPFWCLPSDTISLENNSYDMFTDPMESVLSFGRAAAGMIGGVVKPKSGNSFLSMRGTPRSTLNRKINHQRRFATQQFAQVRIAALASATDSTVNEILTYLCGSCLRRFFKEYNALPDDSLVGVMPVSLQERQAQLPGNAIAGLRVELGTHIGDPVARLDAIKVAMGKVRQDRASLPESAITSYVLMRAAPLFVSQLLPGGGMVPPSFNLGVSNTLAAEQPLYFSGCRLDAVYPISQLMQYSALNIDCVNYAGTFNIGFTGARDTLPHLQRLAVYFGKAVEDLEEVVAEGVAS